MIEKERGEERTANEPGAFLAAVQEAPLYKPNPSSLTICKKPRFLKASGLVLIKQIWDGQYKNSRRVEEERKKVETHCRLILSTSRGSKTISPIPVNLSNNREFSLYYRNPKGKKERKKH